MHPQFKACTVTKTYLARIRGEPPDDTFDCEERIEPRSYAGGARRVDPGGRIAKTGFDVRQRYPDGTTLVVCRPVTGRTNQIRIHLAHLGWPVVGDPTYLPDGEYSKRQTLETHEPSMCLHSWMIELDHPEDGRRVRFEAPLPTWADP